MCVLFVYLQVQRIPAYEGFLQDLLAETDESHPDHEDLTKATKILHTVSIYTYLMAPLSTYNTISLTNPI